jgi:hypothetical protein
LSKAFPEMPGFSSIAKAFAENGIYFNAQIPGNFTVSVKILLQTKLGYPNLT